MADLRIVDAPEIPTENITGEEKLPTGGSGNYSISLDSLADYTKTKKDLADNTSVDGKVNGVRQELDAHIEDLLNPHQVTKGQIGLGNVDNTSDADKPVSNSTQAAIISAVAPKADKSYVDNALSSKSDKTYVDTKLTLKANKVDVYTKQESSDLVNNSIYTALTPVNTSLDLAKRGIANRYDSSFTYNSGERVVLTNGDIVKSIIDGNVNDPNVNMTGWLNIGNTGEVESIADLLAISNPKNGDIILVKHFDKPTGRLKGGGQFIYDSSKSSLNNDGLVLNGWVRVWDTYITPEMFGAKGDGVTDDYDALVKCFNALTPLAETIYDANFQQQTSKSGTVMLSSVVYRHTQPLRLPAMMDVLSSGSINYFLEPSILTNRNKPCFYYDGDDLEVSAVYLPLYINNNDGTWSLNNDSTYIANAGDAAERSMSVGTEFRFNVITKRNTKIGVNLFGHESGNAELGVGTIGTWASDQTAAATMQSQDYNYDDLSPRCGIYVSRAWNGKLTRPRVIAHKTGLYLGRHAAGYVVEQPYINRQLDKHTDAMGLQSEFLPEGIPPYKNVTCGIVMSEFNGTLNNPITEHWGVPYMISKTGATLNKPHIEGSNLIMNHNFIIYQCAVTVNDWSGIRSMYERNGTSIVYSNGMSFARGNFFNMKGAGYYADNSGFILVDGSGFDVNYNGYFLNIENIPHDKLIGIAWFTDSRYIHKVQFASANKYTLYVDETKTGAKKGFGVWAATALQNLSYLDEAIRLLGENWNGNIELNSNLNLTSDMGISSNVNTVVNMNNKTIHANGGSFLLNGNISILFLGTGTLKATSTNLFKNSQYVKRKTQIQTIDGVSFDTTNYIYQLSESPFCDFSLNIHNSNLSNTLGKYANLGSALGEAKIFVKSSTRKTAYDSSPVDGANINVLSKFLN